ncbi:hypothetical protein A3D78_00745 [Candidatus Gottesmanbacteria bacterium RIFCSPHIGHO2_02_FULL_39_14]|uniref:Uncharacterized protein n=2 Tax=Candidatus Gottesmaniibacteriota TaxID=1752720 RepID=A0A1F6A091_9BACT|nr:MAG: hypothetical protein A3D78_00745 [Candidatus Gottesmanbacteria bacterium RIFCSPHIGHO2_02_FULL_39_14]OGG32290.1 MAG: hypothetical protein A3I51_01355 [Candidatus Gottesmanbacteria bacterium RIFCSPLOWO2_02_FULL_38_8]
MSENPRHLAENEIFYDAKPIIFGEGFSKYQNTFEGIFNFDTWLQERILAGKASSLVLDLMADTTFLRELAERANFLHKHSISGIAIGLGDHRSRKDKTYDSRNGVYMLSSEVDRQKRRVIHVADISQEWIWRKLTREQVKRNLSKLFNLIVCRGAGGLEHYLDESYEVHLGIIKKALSLLSSDGILVTQLQTTDNDRLPLYAEEMQKMNFGCSYQRGSGIHDTVFDTSTGLPIAKIFHL